MGSAFAAFVPAPFDRQKKLLLASMPLEMKGARSLRGNLRGAMNAKGNH
jgi:hypothetical protein